ncbi:MAG: hypothetical protein JW757_05405 [Anaerolineales bacterium]|nr:hypothetical protein [Anaerolineales bacterium]
MDKLKSRRIELPALAILLGAAVLYHLSTYIPHVTNYPFSLWWSETTRFYLGSTFFDQRIYGQDLPWVFRDLTRYLIQAVPFLIEDNPLWVHRLWQAGLRFLSGYLVGFVLSRRLKISRPLLAGMFTAWTGLYLFQGPLFYNLAPIVILVLWLVDPKRFWRTILVISVASVYAGLSRINWVPMAGLLAALLYFLEIPVGGKKPREVLIYLVPPAVWTAAGSLLGLAALQLWQLNSGNPPEIFHSSFTSYLLYKRLFPNPSYPLGIVLATLIVSAPLLIYLLRSLHAWRKKWHIVRVAAIVTILLLLGAGGLLVSIKIGGGTNLHNMDVFLVALLLAAVELTFGRVVDEQGEVTRAVAPLWLRALIILVPVGFVFTFTGRNLTPLDITRAQEDLVTLQAYVSEAAAGGDDVLFVSQRHLLTFGLIKDIPLVHAHEKLLLQEMVMSKNTAYLEDFAREMAAQQYAMIVIDPLPEYWKNPDKEPLAMENNVVNRNLVPLILCAYQEKDMLLDGGLQILVPKEEPTCQISEE